MITAIRLQNPTADSSPVETDSIFSPPFSFIPEPELLPVLLSFPESGFSGFYCTQMPEQAVRWATRYGTRGYLNKYEYTENSKLKYLVFEKMTEEWLDFIVDCRRGIAHSYDIVEGPMADDTIYNYIQNYIDGKISRAGTGEV